MALFQFHAPRGKSCRLCESVPCHLRPGYRPAQHGHAKTHSDNELFTFRVWLVRLGLNGEEFKHTRDHLLANLDGDRAWRFDKDSYTVNQKKKKSREMER